MAFRNKLQKNVSWSWFVGTMFLKDQILRFSRSENQKKKKLFVFGWSSFLVQGVFMEPAQLHKILIKLQREEHCDARIHMNSIHIRVVLEALLSLPNSGSFWVKKILDSVDVSALVIPTYVHLPVRE